MNANDFLKKQLVGQKALVMTDASIEVELEIKNIDIKKHSKNLEPATRQNDWWPASKEWSTWEVEFSNGHRKSYSSLSEIKLANQE